VPRTPYAPGVAAIWEEFKNGGWANWIILLFGMGGLALALVATILTAMRSTAGRWVGIATIAMAAFIAGLGLFGVFMGRRMVDQALAGPAVRPSQKERIQRIGYLESKSCAKFAIGWALLPLLAGGIAVLGAAKRKPSAPSAGAWGSPLAPPPAPAATDGAGIGVGIGALAIAALTIGADVAVIAQPLPGRDLDPSDPTWRLLDAKEDIEAGDLDAGCLDLERALGEPGARVPDDIAPLAAKCADHRIDTIVRGPESRRREELATLARSPLLDEAHRQRVAQEIAKLEPAEDAGDAGPGGRRPPPAVRQGAVTVNGRLPPEVIQRIVRQNNGRFRLCYENGLRSDPKLAGRVTVRFVIGRKGEVASAEDGGSDLPDKATVSCVVRAFSALTFPEPEGGIVTVTYPVVFQPG
jgi:hypothetical protein